MKAGDAALVGVVVAHVVHPVVVVGDGELGDHSGLEADEDLRKCRLIIILILLLIIKLIIILIIIPVSWGGGTPAQCTRRPCSGIPTASTVQNL